MIFRVNKQEFEKAITPVSIIAQSKSAESALNGVYIEASGEEVVLYCYDIEKGIKTTVSANVESEGKVVADSQIVPIIHSMPDGEITFSVSDNNIITLSSGEALFQILGRSAEGYPAIPEIKGHTAFSITKKQMKNLINKTIFSVCKDDTNPLLKGSLFEIKDNYLTVSSIDGFRFAVRKEKSAVDNPDLDVSFIIPGKAQLNLLRIMEDNDGEISLELGNKHIIIMTDNLYFVIRLIEGEFPKYEKYIPEYTATAVVDRDELIQSLERVSLVNEKMHSSAKLNFLNGFLKISCETESGKIIDSIAITFTGDVREVLFNQSFLIEALRCCENEKVLLRLAENGKGMVIKARDEDEVEDSYYLYLVMPIRSR
ncbi:MAG: DNA polymerase III subunit beta [Clostridia bacterium]|nr:DNA polymerase III subunit beta [Clostridia bacterium]